MLESDNPVNPRRGKKATTNQEVASSNLAGQANENQDFRKWESFFVVVLFGIAWYNQSKYTYAACDGEGSG